MPKGIYKRTEEHRKNISKARIGSSHSDATKKLMREKRLGKSMSLEARLKISVASKGKIMSREARRRMSVAKTGKPSGRLGIGMGEAFKEARRLSQLGKKHSLATRLKMRESHRGKHSGENNPFWRGGISEENHRIRQSIEYRNWREAVFARDKYTCLNCKLRGGWNVELKRRIVLNADHIQPFSLYPQLRFDLTNGRTLCEECHRKTETWGVNLIYLQSVKLNLKNVLIKNK